MAKSPPDAPKSSGGLEYFVIGVVMSLGLGVPLTLFSIYFFADNVTTLAVAFLCLLGVIVGTGTLVIIFRSRILRSISGVTTRSLNSVTEPSLTAVRAMAQREPEVAAQHGEEAARRLAAWFSWITIRRWILGLIIGLVAAFAGFVGTALLFQQNKLITQQNGLIEEQNAFLREQTSQLRHQIDADEEERLLVRRAEFLNTLYDCKGGKNDEGVCAKPSASPQVRHAALVAYVGIERSYQQRVFEGQQEQGSTQRDTPRRPDLTWLNLEDINLDGESLARVDLSHAYLNENELDGVDFSDAVLSHAHFDSVTFTHVTFRDANLTNTKLSESTLAGNNLSGANLTDAILFKANMSGANLSGANLLRADLRGADLSKANLSSANLDSAKYSKTTLWPDTFDPKAAGAILAF